MAAWHFGVRWIILALCTICLTLTYSNTLALNFTVICMNDVIEDFEREHNSSSNALREEHWLESAAKKNLLFSAIALGTMIGTIPLMAMIHRLGTRVCFTVYGLLSAASTILTPLAVDVGGFWAVSLMRVIQGAAIAVNFPVLGTICEQWSTLGQSSFYIAILSCHLQFSAIFTMPVSGALCASSLGWRSVYYVQGLISVFFFFLFYVFYSDSPALHKRVPPKELEAIREGKGHHHLEGNHKVPYLAAITTPPILGVFVASIGGNAGFQIFFQYGPIYMNKVLGMEVASTGLATALPYILSFLVKFAAGPISDLTTCIGDTGKIILFTSVSQGAMAACIIGLALTTDVVLAQIFFTAAIVFSGLNIVGIIKCAQMVARQHIHFVMAVVSFLNCLLVLVIPGVVGVLAAENTAEQWARIFIGIAVLVIVTNVYFLFVADSKPAPWTTANYGSSLSAGNLVAPKLTEKDSVVWSMDDKNGDAVNNRVTALPATISETRLHNVLAVNNPKVL